MDQVKDNFLRCKKRGWFIPDSPEYTLTKFSSKGYGEAAVLFLINKQLEILLCKRSAHVRFKGQACLPGGTRDSSDISLEHTAVREAHEEVNLDPAHYDVLCTLPPSYNSLRTVTLVTPVIALTTHDKLNLIPNQAEVECVYWVPLTYFLDSQNVRTISKYPCFDFWDSVNEMNHEIWGMTAALCAIAASIALGRPFTLPHYVSVLISQVTNDTNSGQIILTFHSVVSTSNEEKTGQNQKLVSSKL